MSEGGDTETTDLEAEGIEPMLERTPTVLLLDTSGSMEAKTETPDGETKEKITQVNEGLETFRDEVKGKEHASKRVDVALVTFGGGATVQQEFTPIDNWSPPHLRASGKTPMGDAINRAIDIVEERKSSYHNDGVPYNRPLLWLLTDGKPTDMEPGDQQWQDVKGQLADGTENDHFEFFAMGVSGADMATLNDLVEDPTGRKALELQEGMFQEYFRFLSNSLETASDPDSGDSYNLDVEHLQDFAQVG